MPGEPLLWPRRTFCLKSTCPRVLRGPPDPPPSAPPPRPLATTASRTRAALAGIDVEVSRRNLRQREQEVEAEGRGAVRNLKHIRTSVDLQRRAVEVAVQQYRLALLRYERGLASNFDVGEAEGNLVAARSALASLLKSYQASRLELERATGTLAPDREFAP